MTALDVATLAGLVLCALVYALVLIQSWAPRAVDRVGEVIDDG